MQDTHRPNASQQDSKSQRRVLELVVVCVVATTFLVTGGLAYLFAANQIGHWAIWEKPGAISGQQWFEHIRNAATFVGVPAVGSALVFSYFRQRSTDKSVGLTKSQLDLTSEQVELARRQIDQAIAKDEREHLSRVREGFSEATNRLADDDVMQRSAGISMMVSVASDFQALRDVAGRQDCIDALVQLLHKLGSKEDGGQPARRLWATIEARMQPSMNDATNWWDCNIDISGLPMRLGVLHKWVSTGGIKKISAAAISSGSTCVVQNITMDGGDLSVHMDESDTPIRVIQSSLERGTLTIDFSMGGGPQFISFEDCVFDNIRLVFAERMDPAPKRTIKFFRCVFSEPSFNAQNDIHNYDFEFSQCNFTGVPIFAPRPEASQPRLELWDRNTFFGEVARYEKNPEDASHFDRWSRKYSPYS